VTDAPGSSSADAAEEEPVVILSEAEADSVADIVVAYLRAMPTERQGPYADLLEQVSAGRVSGATIEILEQVCSVSLETGQARRIGTAEVEGHVAAVFRRTPEGSARLGQLRDINAALERLRGKELTNAQIASQRPGRYTLTLGVPGFAIGLVITPTGVELSSLSTG